MKDNKGPEMDVKFSLFRKTFEETEVVKRDTLKPQWLRDFQDSQRQGQSTLP